MISFIIGALKVIILLGTLIILHEFGHFIVAKFCNVKVLKFSIGFGPNIIKKQGKETEYSVRALPLGGFVQLEGEDDDSNDERAFSKKPIWQRLLVLIAGITFNILFALLIYLCIYMNINDYVTTTISNDTDSNILAEYGLEVGDIIYKVNGAKVYNDLDIARIIDGSKKDEIDITIKNTKNEIVTNTINVPNTYIGYAGLVFSENVVYQIMTGMAGDRAGFKINDEIMTINGISGDIYTIISVIQENPEKELVTKVNRENEIVELKLVPDSKEVRELEVEFVEIKDLKFFDNLYYAWKETKYYLKANVIGILELFSGKSENVEVQGIVGISGEISKTKSLVEFFYLMSAISMSLGIMNLLPIPGLDGGKILITLIELVRRKPIKKETEMKITMIGFFILLALMIYVTMADVSKLIK